MIKNNRRLLVEIQNFGPCPFSPNYGPGFRGLSVCTFTFCSFLICNLIISGWIYFFIFLNKLILHYENEKLNLGIVWSFYVVGTVKRDYCDKKTSSYLSSYRFRENKHFQTIMGKIDSTARSTLRGTRTHHKNSLSPPYWILYSRCMCFFRRRFYLHHIIF